MKIVPANDLNWHTAGIAPRDLPTVKRTFMVNSFRYWTTGGFVRGGDDLDAQLELLLCVGCPTRQINIYLLLTVASVHDAEDSILI